MSVEDWAENEASKVRRSGKRSLLGPVMLEYDMEEEAFAHGIVHAFSALLSDEATIAGARLLDRGGFSITERAFRAALQAAVDAVTKGDTE